MPFVICSIHWKTEQGRYTTHDRKRDTDNDNDVWFSDNFLELESVMIGVLIAMTLIAVGLAIEVIRDRAKIAELEHKESDWL